MNESDSSGSADAQKIPPSQKLMQMITGHWVASAVYAAARLQIADHLRDGPKSYQDLAETVSADSRSLYRLLRALSSVDLFQETEPGIFSLGSVGEYLVSDHPQSMRAMSLFQGAAPHQQGWISFLHSVKTGTSAFEHVHGMQFFDYCAVDADFSEAFNGAMTAFSATAAEAIVNAYDFSGIGRLVDIGGGHGKLMAVILSRYSDVSGGVFDLPHVVEGASALLDKEGVLDRCEIHGGDFFEAVPEADAYISKNIIHDWGDEESLKILRNMRSSITEDGRVLLVEAVIAPGNGPDMAKFLDLEMLNSTHGGRERTEQEFAELFQAAGMKLNRIVKTKSPAAVIEAVAV